MIETPQLSEKEYRSLDRISYSMIKDFLTKGRRYYYKKHVLKEKVPFEVTQPMLTGSLADCLLFEPQNLEELFHISDSTKAPTGKSLDFVKNLFTETLEYPEKEFMERVAAAYKKADMAENRYNGFVEKFPDSDLEKYFQHLLESLGKTVVTLQDMSNAEKIVNELKFGRNTKHIFQAKGLGQLPILWDYKGRAMKAKIDWLLIDDAEEMLRPFDLKCIAQVEEFPKKWLWEGYFIQERLYSDAIRAWRDEHYPTYGIDKFKFVVVDSILYVNPLIFDIQVSRGDLATQFETKFGKVYKGVDWLLEEIDTHSEMNMWSSSLEDWNNLGIRNETI